MEVVGVCVGEVGRHSCPALPCPALPSPAAAPSPDGQPALVHARCAVAPARQRRANGARRATPQHAGCYCPPGRQAALSASAGAGTAAPSSPAVPARPQPAGGGGQSQQHTAPVAPAPRRLPPAHRPMLPARDAAAPPRRAALQGPCGATSPPAPGGRPPTAGRRSACCRAGSVQSALAHAATRGRGHATRSGPPPPARACRWGQAGECGKSVMGQHGQGHSSSYPHFALPLPSRQPPHLRRRMMASPMATASRTAACLRAKAARFRAMDAASERQAMKARARAPWVRQLTARRSVLRLPCRAGERGDGREGGDGR